MAKHDKPKQQPLSGALTNQPSPESMVTPAEHDQREAELAALRTSLREFQELSAARAAEVLGLKAELEQERARANGEYQRCEAEMLKSTALRSDMMVLGQALAGRVPEVPLQTDLGKSAAAGLGELLHTLATLREQRQDGRALPANGWASESARQLVEAVPPHERSLLLGDLLAQLLPHTGETGQNETASDTLKRLRRESTEKDDAYMKLAIELEDERKKTDTMSERMVKVQSAMAARRAPDADAGAIMTWVEQAIRPAIAVHCPTGKRPLAPEIIEKVVSEWKSMRGFFSEAPLVAVAVRDDGAKVHERFSLLVLNWDGKSVSARAVEEVRPWGDISPYLEQTVRKSLIPGAYR